MSLADDPERRELEADEDAICIGDYITLRGLGGEGYLEAEGILEDSVSLDSNPLRFDDCTFQVCNQNQYSAANELADWMAARPVDDDSSVLLGGGGDASIADDGDDGSEAEMGEPEKVMRSLEKSKMNEQSLNMSYFKQRIGSALTFSQIVQLRHVKSGKYLTISAAKVAQVERENLQVYLSDDGSPLSWLAVCPRHKIDRDGSEVSNKSEVYLSVQQRVNEFLHCSSSEVANKAGTHEVNCSLEKSSWRLTLFHKFQNPAETELRCGDVICLSDPEDLSNLELLPPSFTTMSDHLRRDRFNAFFNHGSGEVANSNALWMVERHRYPQAGGQLQYKERLYRFRHLNSGRYLGVKPKTMVKKGVRMLKTAAALARGHLAASADASGVADEYVFASHEEGRKASCGFRLASAHSGYDNNSADPDAIPRIHNESAIQVEGQGRWLHRGPQNEDLNNEVGMKLLPCKAMSERKDTVSLLISRSSVSVMDIQVGVSALPQLKKFGACIKKYSKQPETLATLAIPFRLVVDKLINHIVGKGLSEDVPFSNSHYQGLKKIAEQPGRISSVRQVLLREQGVLSELLGILDKLLQHGPADDGKKSKHSKHAHENWVRIRKTIAKPCFWLLYLAIREDSPNQMHVADMLTTFISYVPFEPISTLCIMEMLETNMDLQESKVTDKVIDTFIELIRNSRMNSMYIHLLKAACSCGGKGVDGNQCTVVDKWLENGADEQIAISFAPDGLSEVKWARAKPKDGAYTLGWSAVEGGMHAINLSWSWAHAELCPLALGGSAVPGSKMSQISLVSLFSNLDANASSGSMSPAKYKTARTVVYYLIAQMYLAAEICLDRNYQAMQYLQEQLPYDVLIAILRHTAFDEVKVKEVNMLRAATVRLITTLYVDSDPQAAQRTPRLSRMWGSLSGDVSFPCVESTRTDRFYVLQDTLGVQLGGLSSGSWDELTRTSMQLLLKLVQFRFYSTAKDIKAVVVPLVESLDWRDRGDKLRPRTPGHHPFDTAQAALDETENGAIDGAVNGGRKLSRRFSSAAVGNSLRQLANFNVGSKYGAKAISPGDDDEPGLLEDDSHQVLFVDTPKVPWQSKTLDFLGSIPVMVAILLLVFVGLIFAVNSEVTGESQPGVKIFEHFASGIFFVELVLRMGCYRYVKGNISTFFSDPFSFIDFVIVAIDVVVYSLMFASSGSSAGSLGSLAKGGRSVRIIRLVRLAKCASVASKMNKKADAELEDLWELPGRYHAISESQLSTMLQMVNILGEFTKVAQDFKLSKILDEFRGWHLASGESESTPGETFEAVVVSADGFRLDPPGVAFDEIFLDLCMYESPALVQSALTVLMDKNSERMALLNDLKNTQIISSDQMTADFKIIETMLQELQSAAEQQELWGELESDDDRATNEKVKKILMSLKDLARCNADVLNMESRFVPNTKIQDMMRNLGGFEVAMTVLELQASLNDTEDEEIISNTKDILRLCNQWICWFIVGNETNQRLMFGELEFFCDTLDDDIESASVVADIFKGNDKLSNDFPPHLIVDLTTLILRNGLIPAYLEPMQALTFQSDTIQSSNLDLQFDILKNLTSGSRVHETVWICADSEGDEYKERNELMAESTKFLLEESATATTDDLEKGLHLAEKLRYHSRVLNTLAGTAAGNVNITTVEAKLQNMYGPVQVLEAMLDPGLCLEIKADLYNFFFQAVIDVEIAVPGLEKMAVMWDWLEVQVSNFAECCDELVAYADPNSTDRDAYVARLRLKTAWVAAEAIAAFFKVYFHRDAVLLAVATADEDEESDDDQLPDNSPARPDSPMGGSKADSSFPTIDKYDSIILQLFHGIRNLKLKGDELQLFSATHVASFVEALDELRTACPSAETADVDIGPRTPVGKGDDEEPDSAATASGDEAIDSGLKQFRSCIENDEGLMEHIADDRHSITAILEALPSRYDDVDADLRIEPLIEKLVRHTRSRIEVDGRKKKLDPECTATTLWLIQVFRSMIEKKWGMGIDERDDEGGAEQDEAGGPTVDLLSRNGVVTLCLDLIAVGIDEELVLECVNLGVACLFKEGGAPEVQDTMYQHLANGASMPFFEAIKSQILEMDEYYNFGDIVIEDEPDEDEDPETPDNRIVLRFIQLMCEGHFEPNQDIIRDQKNNRTSINLLDTMSLFLNTLSKKPCRSASACANDLTALICEVIQGPCTGNQRHFALETEAIEILNRIMRSKPVNDCIEDEELDVKKCAIEIFEALVEGQGEGSVIYDRMLSVVDIEMLKIMIESGDEEDELDEVQIEALVLLQMMCDYDPILKKEIELPPRIEKAMGTDVVSVEVIWNGKLQRRFFPVPAICRHISEATKSNLVENVDRMNQEAKLQDFCMRARDIYREIQHQDWLASINVTESVNISQIFSRQNQETATWIAFSTACLINMLYLWFFAYPVVQWKETKNGDYKLKFPEDPGMPALVEAVQSGLNVFNIVASVFTLLLFLIVRVPVTYKGYTDDTFGPPDMGSWRAIMATSLDFMTMYYFLYLFLACSVQSNPALGTLLLLDIVVKNSTTRDVLNAVVYPWKSLFFTVLLGLFIIYIFAMNVFLDFPDDFVADGSALDCSTLFKCFKASSNYGLRLSGGIGDIMTHTLKDRLILDIGYFVIVLVILLNVIFGIIIDTFSELRQKKMDRLADTHEVCFICGNTKLDFDRNSEEPNGFSNHYHNDHNLWKYMQFIIFIWEQDKDDDDGLELFVRQMLERGEIGWFPVLRAMCLRSEATDDDDMTQRIDTLANALEVGMNQQSDLLIRAIARTNETMQRAIDQLGKKSAEQHREAIKGAKLDDGVKMERAESMSATGGIRPPQHEHESKVSISAVSGAYMKVNIHDAKDLVPPHLLGNSDPFAIVHVYWNDEKVGESETTHLFTTSPKWPSTTANSFLVKLPKKKATGGGRLRFEVYHAHRRGLGYFLGQSEMDFSGIATAGPDKVYRRLVKKVDAPPGTQNMVQGSLGVTLEISNKT